MSNVEKDLTKFKLELAPEWRALQSNKYKRPKWVKIPRLLDNDNWLGLSNDARALLITLLLIASERDNYELPEWSTLLRRLQAVGNVFQAVKTSRLIHELIQGKFLRKAVPELQSYRVSELQSPLLRKADLTVGEVTQTGGVGEEERDENSALLAQPKRPYSKLGALSLVPTSEVMEILGIVPRAAPTSITTPNHLTYAEAMAQSSGPPSGRFEKTRHNGWELG